KSFVEMNLVPWISKTLRSLGRTWRSVERPMEWQRGPILEQPFLPPWERGR
ncbi:hypothetical protein Csa_017574, partial [Cucumis sativus]